MEENNQSYYAIIPANVRYDKDLPPNAKLLYGEITALCNTKGCCWATNDYFAQLYGVSKTSISKWISILIRKGYIKSEINYKGGTKEIDNRYLRLVNDPIEEKLNTPIEEKLKENNTSMNNTSNNISVEPPYEEIIDYVNNCAGLNPQLFTKKITFNFDHRTENTRKLIKTLWNKKLDRKQMYTLKDFKYVIACKYNDFVENEKQFSNGELSSKYYKPATLFAASNFSKYLEEAKQMYDE